MSRAATVDGRQAGTNWFVATLVAATLVWAFAVDSARAENCARSDFEAVVDQAGETLGALNNRNRPAFQAKLRDLKDKRGWSHEAFLARAAPFVQDDKINGFDNASQRLLGQISVMGEEGAEARRPDCKLLDALRARMQDLVTAQEAKWAYMFSKLDKALSE